VGSSLRTLPYRHHPSGAFHATAAPAKTLADRYLSEFAGFQAARRASRHRGNSPFAASNALLGASEFGQVTIGERFRRRGRGHGKAPEG